LHFLEELGQNFKGSYGLYDRFGDIEERRKPTPQIFRPIGFDQ
jgi:hypothetical protein